MNSFLKEFLSVFDWLCPKTLEEKFEDLDHSMQNLYDRMGWGSYTNPLKNTYVLSPDMEIISLKEDMNNSICSETVDVEGNTVTITTSKRTLEELK